MKLDSSFKGSITIKKTHLLNMIQSNRLIFLSEVSKESKRFAWGRQTAFEDMLEGWISDYDWDVFMQKIPQILPRPWIGQGLNFILGDNL